MHRIARTEKPMKPSILLLSSTLLLSGALIGCGDSSTTTTTDSATAPAGQTAPPQGGGMMPGMTAPGSAPSRGQQRPGGQMAAGTPAAGAVENSWDVVRKKTKFSLVAASGQSAVKPVKDGALPAGGLRPDPFESMIKLVVPEIPAFTLVLPRRLASQYRPVPPEIKDQDPNLYRGPLPPVARRVAGVMYNGAITAILETGEASGAVRHDVIRPGSIVPFGLDGLPDLTVESITMTALILRAPDGRTVEVKLSGLPPAVADSLRAQFGGSATGGGAPSMPGMGGPQGGGGGDKGGGGVRDF